MLDSTDVCRLLKTAGTGSHLHGQDIVAAHALQDLGHVVEADAHAQVPVATEVLKAIRAQLQGELHSHEIHRNAHHVSKCGSFRNQQLCFQTHQHVSGMQWAML